MAKQPYTIAAIQADEMHYLIDWAKQEGWNPGLYDAQCFFHTDPQGFFIGRLNGEVIACASTVCYDSQFAFAGFYIVKPTYRGQGYGLKLSEACLSYAGHRNIGVDGVVDRVEDYKRFGLRPAHLSCRYRGLAKHCNLTINDPLIPLAQIDFDALVCYDQNLFPVQRRQFLAQWIRQPQSIGYAYLYKEKIVGYGLIRKCFDGYKIGPLFADNHHVGEALFQALYHSAAGFHISIDIPQPNTTAIKLIERYVMSKDFCCMRMYRYEAPHLDLERIYGITTFELG